MNPGWIEESLYSMIKEKIPLPCVDLLVMHQDRLLLMKRRNNPAKGLWFTPGGRIYKGESLEEAVTRVLSEETGLNPAKITQCGAMSHNWPEVQTITVYYRVDVDSDIVIMNNEHEDYRWVSESDKTMHPYLIQMIRISEIFCARMIENYL